MLLKEYINLLSESAYIVVLYFQKKINAANLMTIFINIIIILYVLGLPSVPAKHCNFNVTIEHILTNEGFHRILNYFINLASDDGKTRWLYEDCMVGIEQTLPAGVYASPDEIKTHNCKDLIHSIFKMPVNTELFAEDASPIMLQLFGHVTKNQTHMHIHVPMHARYHRAKAGGRAVRYDIPQPKMYLSCPNKKLEKCGDFYHGLSDTNNFCLQHVSIEQCHWKQIPADIITPPLYWYVAVGNLQHYYIVTFGTTLVIIVGSLYLLKTIHEYKICVAESRAAAGVSPRAPGGGGEPRAARLHAARGRSAPPPRAPPAPPRALPAPPRRRARSSAPALSDRVVAGEPTPRLRPVFLWARQLDGEVQEVRCEDYDPRNRIRIARTPSGWRVIPRTEIYNSIRVPLPPATPLTARERRRRRRSRRRARSAASVALDRSEPTAPTEPADRPEPAAWLQPDLESHIPSHTIAVPRPPPTPLDNLLAVAELEFNQQRSERLLDLDDSAPYPFLPAEEVARDVMSFELGEPKQVDETMYFDRKAPPDRVEEYASEIGSHKDLFETISEVHYLPELGGPHDEALLESLVEKGCEDNQILGQALDKLAHLVHGSGEYAEEEEDMLLSSAPVSDIIERLEQTLESPGQSSITAAQGLLHLHHIGDHLAQEDPNQRAEQTYMSEEVFVPEETSQCQVDTLQPTIENQEVSEVNHVDYCMNAEKSNENEIGGTDAVYPEPVLDTKESYDDKNFEEPQSQIPIPEQSEVNTLNGRINDESALNDICSQKNEQMEENLEEEMAEAALESIQQNTPPSQDSNDGYDKENSQESTNKDEQPTDLSTKHVEKNTPSFILANDNDTSHLDDNMSGNDEQPRDLTVHRRLPTPHASPRRTDVPRAPSRESDAMQSPQPSGIPAVPSSPEIFTMPLTKSKQTLFLETLLSSPSPKMYTSEVTITKQQCEPLNLGKHRKSASPTVSSCSDEMKKLNKEFGEPQEKKLRRESTEELAKISKVLRKCSDEQISKKPEKPHVQTCDESTPQQQFQLLKSSPEFHIPDPLLVPKDKLNSILAAPGREIPALLLQRPELRLPEAFAYPAVLQDPDILVISLSQLENIIENEEKNLTSPKPKEKESKPISSSKTYTRTEQTSTPQPDQTSQPKPIPSMDALAGDIDAATSAALNQMLWLPYLSQLEAMAACSQNMDFLKALNSSGYNGPNYPDLSQMFNPSARFMGPGGFPMMPSMDYDNRLQFAMWQEAMSHANASSSQRPKPTTMAEQMKELSKSTDVQNPFVHSTKNHPNKPHSSARTSPIAHNYNNQRSMAHNPFLQGMYPGMNPNMRPNMPIPGLQIPYFNPQMIGNQRSPRTGQQKSPNSPYYPNNNYLQAVKQSESQSHPRTPTTQESTRPRISVKSLHNLLEPSAAAASGVGSSRRTPSTPTSALGRRREEPEVGSTTPLGEPPHMPPHPHDPSSFHLWHPLFGNQKSYNSPWSWTTVTATGD